MMGTDDKQVQYKTKNQRKVSEGCLPNSYFTEQELENRIQKKVKENDWFRSMEKKTTNWNESNFNPFILNGKEYNSIKHAHDHLGASKAVLQREYDKLMKSSFSEHEFKASVTTYFTMKKVKEA